MMKFRSCTKYAFISSKKQFFCLKKAGTSSFWSLPHIRRHWIIEQLQWQKDLEESSDSDKKIYTRKDFPLKKSVTVTVTAKNQWQWQKCWSKTVTVTKFRKSEQDYSAVTKTAGPWFFLCKSCVKPSEVQFCTKFE